MTSINNATKEVKKAETVLRRAEKRLETTASKVLEKTAVPGKDGKQLERAEKAHEEAETALELAKEQLEEKKALLEQVKEEVRAIEDALKEEALAAAATSTA
jgi:archaellum component FlaC